MRDHSSDEQTLDAARGLMAECAAVAAAEADAAFPEERLERQRARILQRIEQDGRPGRVISFPAGQHHVADRADIAADVHAVRPRTTARWVAGAAAAGLVIGVLAGQMVPELGGFSAPPQESTAVVQARQPARTQAPAASVRVVATSMSDEELLLRVDSVIDRSGGTALGPLDQMTPRVWEVAAQ